MELKSRHKTRERGRYFCWSLGLSGKVGGQLVCEGRDGEEKVRERYIEGSKTETRDTLLQGDISNFYYR